MPRGKYTEYDSQVLTLLKHGPHTPRRIGKYLGVDVEISKTILRRLKWKGLIKWRGGHESARLKHDMATADPSIFPRPWWPTPNGGWFG